MAYNCNLRKQRKVTVSIRTTIAHNGTSRGTQLNFEDPVLMGNVKRSSIDKPTPELATLKVLAEFYKGILESSPTNVSPVLSFERIKGYKMLQLIKRLFQLNEDSQ
ncbi:hypothetical protein T09_10006 [Trichinella sp. T9]|nr:hypothetical protein T09_10006 [Trichinella sp. T9]